MLEYLPKTRSFENGDHESSEFDTNVNGSAEIVANGNKICGC